MKPRIVVVGTVLIVGALALSGCSSSIPADSIITPQATVDPRIAQSSLACGEFHDAENGLTKHLLTDTEYRAKITKVNDDALVATPDVQNAATELLGMVTELVVNSPQYTEKALIAALVALNSACTAAGWEGTP